MIPPRGMPRRKVTSKNVFEDQNTVRLSIEFLSNPGEQTIGSGNGEQGIRAGIAPIDGGATAGNGLFSFRIRCFWNGS